MNYIYNHPYIHQKNLLQIPKIKQGMKSVICKDSILWFLVVEYNKY